LDRWLLAWTSVLLLRLVLFFSRTLRSFTTFTLTVGASAMTSHSKKDILAPQRYMDG
jgi:hypothetical protein